MPQVLAHFRDDIAETQDRNVKRPWDWVQGPPVQAP